MGDTICMHCANFLLLLLTSNYWLHSVNAENPFQCSNQAKSFFHRWMSQLLSSHCTKYVFVFKWKHLNGWLIAYFWICLPSFEWIHGCLWYAILKKIIFFGCALENENSTKGKWKIFRVELQFEHCIWEEAWIFSKHVANKFIHST